MNYLTRRRILMLAVLLILLGFKMISCDTGGASCEDTGCEDSGCEGCGGSGGFSMLPYGAYPLEDKIINLGQARVTQAGFSWIQNNAMPLVMALLGQESLCFPLDETNIVDVLILKCDLCPGGCEICMDITNVIINPLVPDKLEIKIFLASDTAIELPTNCGCGVRIDTSNQPLEVTVLVLTQIDGDTRMLDLVVQPPQFNMDQIDISLFGLCDALDFLGLLDALIGIVKQIAEPMIRDMVEGIVTEMVEGFKCKKCTTEPCPDPYGMGVTCDDKDICRKPNNKCILAPMGIEAEVDVGAFLEGTFPGLESRIWMSLAAGGRAQVIENGLEIGLFGGTMVPPDNPDPCTEKVTYPGTGTSLERIPIGNINVHDPQNELYHVGIGVREEFLDQAGYTLQNSGLLCLMIDDSLFGGLDLPIDISWTTFSIFVPSVHKLTHRANAPLAIKLEPGDPIDFGIRDGAELFPETPGVDLGLEVHVNDMKLNFYGLVEDRFVRMFTMQINADVALGIDNQASAIQIVFGLENVLLSNFRVPFSILGEDPEAIAVGLEDLIGSALELIPLDPIEPIEIPGFDLTGDGVEDLYIDIQTLAPEMPKLTTSPTEYKAIYVYASIDDQPPARSLSAETTADVIGSFNPTAQELRDGKRPWISLALSGVDHDGGDANLEYSFSIDKRIWTPWSKDMNPTVKTNMFLWQGRHELKVRARDARDRRSIDETPVTLHFLTDFTEPSVRLLQESGRVKFIGEDNITQSPDLEYRHRMNQGVWTEWSGNTMIDLYRIDRFPMRLDVQAKDEAGLVGTAIRTYSSAESPAEVETKTDPRASFSTTGAVGSLLGCSSRADGASWLLLLMVLPLLALRRVRSMPLFLVLAMSAGMLLAGCDDDSAGTVQCSTDNDCPGGQICVNGKCKTGGGSCEFDSQCPEGWECINDICQEPHTNTDGDEPEEVCQSDEDCGKCEYCSKLQEKCLEQLCHPDSACSHIPSCADSTGDACSECLTDQPVYQCKVPRCGEDSDCDCRAADCNDPSLAPEPYCHSASGACKCREICMGGCALQGEGEDPFEFCCTVYNPSGDCMTCPDWCQGDACASEDDCEGDSKCEGGLCTLTCPPGFTTGSCHPDDPECMWHGLWELCGNYDPATCIFSGTGFLGDDPNCICMEKPPLPIGFHGRYNDIALYNDTNIWLSAYSDEYGDLMVGQAKYPDFQYILNEEDKIFWSFVDGVPDVDPTDGPSGPRGGVSDEGIDVGKYSSLALNSDGWPRVAYQDVTHGDLLFIYTDGQLAEDNDPGDGGDGEEREEDEYSRYVWTKILVDEYGDTGYYTDIWLDSQGRPVIAYMMAGDESGTISSLKLAMANTASPTAPEDFIIVTIDTTTVGEVTCAGCVDSDGVPPGIGINPTIASHPDGQFWVLYYHHTTYDPNADGEGGGDNAKVGVLKRAVLNGGAPDPATLATTDWSKGVFLGSSGTAIAGDVGVFNDFSIIPTTGWYVVAVHNATMNRLEFVYNFGDQLRHHIADDGWRRDRQTGKYYTVSIGAGLSAALDNIGYTRILYQDQTCGYLMFYSEHCNIGSDECDDKVIDRLLGEDTTLDFAGNTEKYGKSYGYYQSQALVGMLSIISNYTVILSGPVQELKLELLTAPQLR